MKITADTNFLVSAAQWDNSSAHKTLKKAIQKNVDIFTSKEILDEFSEVLQRDFKYDKEKISEIMKNVSGFTTLAEPKEKLEIIKEDSDDNKILECAVESKSDNIVTYDHHLLNLKEFRGIKIKKPEDIIDSI